MTPYLLLALFCAGFGFWFGRVWERHSRRVFVGIGPASWWRWHKIARVVRRFDALADPFLAYEILQRTDARSVSFR